MFEGRMGRRWPAIDVSFGKQLVKFTDDSNSFILRVLCVLRALRCNTYG
jgi:hypothetical protein